MSDPVRTVTITMPPNVAQAAYNVANEFAEQSNYGHFIGGDPRDFTPDPECSTPEERAAHKAACEAWGRGEGEDAPTVVGAETQGGGVVVMHCRNFGLGTIVLRDPLLKAFCHAVESAAVAGRGDADVAAMEARALAATADVHGDEYRLYAPEAADESCETIVEWKHSAHPNAQNDGRLFEHARADVLTLVARLRERDAEYLELTRRMDARGAELRAVQTEAHTARRERDEARAEADRIAAVVRERDDELAEAREVLREGVRCVECSAWATKVHRDGDECCDKHAGDGEWSELAQAAAVRACMAAPAAPSNNREAT